MGIMRMRTLGKSGIMVGEIGLGTWGLAGEAYGDVPAEQVTATLEAAAREGVSFFETADCYGNGAVLARMGEFLRGHNRDRFVVSVRLGVQRDAPTPQKNFTPRYLTDACDRALAALGVDTLDCAVLHNPMPETLTRGEAWTTLGRLREAGKARLLGVSVGSVAQGRAALDLGADLLVVPYNMLFPRLLHELSGEIVTAGAAVVARSPLAYGILSDGWTAGRRFPDEDHRSYRWTAADLGRRMRQREAARALVHGTIKTLREAALRYVLANGLVSVVVPGARTPEHARLNAHAADTQPYLPDDDLASIGDILARSGVAT